MPKENGMEFISYRALPDRPADLRRKLEETGELILTLDGEPMALMLPIPKGGLKDMVLLLSQVRARLALTSIREQARERGLNTMALKQANRLVKRARAAGRKKRAG
jgi:DNA-binding MurR/RpiR family transcriptional regulator